MDSDKLSFVSLNRGSSSSAQGAFKEIDGHRGIIPLDSKGAAKSFTEMRVRAQRLQLAVVSGAVELEHVDAARAFFRIRTSISAETRAPRASPRLSAIIDGSGP